MHEPFVAICSRVAQSHHDCGASPRLWCFAAMSSVRSESVDSGMTAASGDVGEEVHFLSDRAWDLVDIQSERRAADQSTDLVGQTPFLAPATAGLRMPAISTLAPRTARTTSEKTWAFCRCTRETGEVTAATNNSPSTSSTTSSRRTLATLSWHKRLTPKLSRACGT